jgi:hypothetical protein
VVFMRSDARTPFRLQADGHPARPPRRISIRLGGLVEQL